MKVPTQFLRNWQMSTSEFGFVVEVFGTHKPSTKRSSCKLFVIPIKLEVPGEHRSPWPRQNIILILPANSKASGLISHAPGS